MFSEDYRYSFTEKDLAEWVYGGGDYEDLAVFMGSEDRMGRLRGATSELQDDEPDTKVARAAIEWKFESLKVLQDQAAFYRNPEQWPGSTQEVYGPRSTRDKASMVAKRLYELCTKEVPNGSVTRRLLYMMHRENVLFEGEPVCKREIDAMVEVALFNRKDEKPGTAKIWTTH